MKLGHVAVLSVAAAAALDLASGLAAAEPQPLRTRDAAIAMAYIDALVSHDASNVPFAPDATRVEAGIQTGYSGPQLSNDLEHGVQYSVIQRIHDVRISEDGDVVNTRYLLDSGFGGVRLVTVDITESFVIRDGLIQSIAATIVPVG
ncbi:hypothetical protein GPX89_05150 [Nocardia sp. ET3-3]|uniref:DUF8021 domain-containing protein n=1 Tax=Nocardia terrae TaxID=2675851 RepID=A0A7K1UQL9_9NOCA|nr:hypothetical protein [Nocardia terrae]MVU76631.1 hypothetical protein [Nocardia terrae]